MYHYFKTAVITLSTALTVLIPTVAKAITFQFDWTGQIAGFGVTGLFSYDETQSYTDGIVRTNDLDFLNVSFFDPQGNLLITYTDNHLDAGVNFNFDAQTKQILQSGTYFDPDGINIGDGSRSDGLTFWSKPPQSSTPHVHVDDWMDEFGFPLGFSSHEDVAFPTRTTQELIDTGRVGETYVDELTNLQATGEFAKVSSVPEPATLIGVVGLGGFLLTSTLQRQKR
ncbi:MAG: PEP-CTERM sorting domain-containing protein [Trichodesmium sp. MO_231.B1]|nr:PEP-CTERM sorting domain-containing protein [Trichodesmium sp. MO_231.B1]